MKYVNSLAAEKLESLRILEEYLTILVKSAIRNDQDSVEIISNSYSEAKDDDSLAFLVLDQHDKVVSVANIFDVEKVLEIMKIENYVIDNKSKTVKTEVDRKFLFFREFQDTEVYYRRVTIYV